MSNVSGSSFLQSKKWADFKAKNNIKSFLIQKNKAFYAYVFEHALSLGIKYFFIPYGYYIDDTKEVSQNIKNLILSAKDKKASWIRVEVNDINELKIWQKYCGSYKILKSKSEYNPATTLILDLKKPEEEIFSGFNKKTRYAIKQSQKHEVLFYKSKTKQDLENFMILLAETNKRNGISQYNFKYYFNLLDTFSDNIDLYFASYNNEVLASMLVINYEKTATYLFGASSDKYRSINITSGLYWYSIKESKKNGFDKFDFWGVKAELVDGKLKAKKGAWEGLSRMKIGFCPKCQMTKYEGSWDIVINPSHYFLYNILHQFRVFLKNIIKRLK